MKNLRLYEHDTDFKTVEQAAGGDGNKVVTIVPGVSMSKDIRKRYFNPNDDSIKVFTLAATYTVSGSQETLKGRPEIKVKYVSGATSQVNINAPSFPFYLPVSPYTTVTIPTNTAVTFEYVEKDATDEYLTFQILSSGTIYWRMNYYNFPTLGKTIEYSKNNGSWTSIDSSSRTPINVSSGDVITFRGNNQVYYHGQYINYFSASTNCKFNVRGNIMSLIDSSNFKKLKSLSSPSTFSCLFNNCSAIINANKLVLPATTLTESCYASMFGGCTSLTTAPELPATTLANRCYQSMFAGCTSLTTAPALPATTLAQYCYSEMFRGCTSLNYIKCLATDISAYSCTYYWLLGVAASGTFVKAPSMTSWITGNSGIPNNWTVQNATQ